MTKPYLIALQNDTPSPFKHENAEVSIQEKDEKAEEKG